MSRLMKSSMFILPLLLALPFAGTASAQQVSELRQCGLQSPDAILSNINGPATSNATTNNFTMEAWVNPNGTHQIDQESQSGVAGMQGENYLLHPSHGTHSWGVGHAGAGMSVGSNGVSVYEHWEYNIPAVLVYSGKIEGWTHVAVVYRDRVPSLYINGTLVKTGTQSAMQFVHPSTDGIGGGYYGRYGGDVDNIRLWNAPRTTDEIRSAMNKTYNTTPHLLESFHSVPAPQNGHRSGVENQSNISDNALLRNSQMCCLSIRRPVRSQPVTENPQESQAVKETPLRLRLGNVATQQQIINVMPDQIQRTIPVQVQQIVAPLPQAPDLAMLNATACRPVNMSEIIAAQPNIPAVAAKPTAPATGGAILESCRPNPITEHSTIGYSLPANGHVTMRIFDAKGDAVKTLVDDDLTAGAHTAEVSGSIFPASGTYFCRMEWNGGTISQKMTVVK
ncbi:MAG: LamG-like jellyroll fold domain-containing protein [Bacteroidota bacterium]